MTGQTNLLRCEDFHPSFTKQVDCFYWKVLVCIEARFRATSQIILHFANLFGSRGSISSDIFYVRPAQMIHLCKEVCTGGARVLFYFFFLRFPIMPPFLNPISITHNPTYGLILFFLFRCHPLV